MRVIPGFRIEVVAERMHRSASGSISGVLAVEVNGRWFPERDWNDFPVVVLGWWLQSWRQVAQGSSASFRFMDGPYSFAAYWQGNRLCLALQDEHKNGADPELVGALSPETVGRAIESAAAAVLRACHHAGWSGADVDTLKRELAPAERL